MGCDIHIAVEYDHPELGWQPFIIGGVFIPRDYELFGALAGVRMPGDRAPLHLPRGFPDDATDIVWGAFYMLVAPDERPDFRTFGFSTILRSQTHDAAVVSRSCEMIDDAAWVLGPDYHSLSYLGRRELLSALDQCDVGIDSLSREFRCIMDSLASLDTRFDGDRSRLLIAFDN